MQGAVAPPAAPARPRGERVGRVWLRRGDATIVSFFLALVAAGVDALQLSRPGFLLGLTPDISVYLAGAVRLVHGAIPYRDFVFVQPPGVVLALSPAALLSNLLGTRWALAVIRLATPAIAGANVLLLGRLVRHRGRVVTAVACGLLAAYPGFFYALNAGLLEPLVDLFCLGAAVLIFQGDAMAGRRRMAWGGVLLGLAATIKLPALVLILAVALVAGSGLRRRLLPFLGGVMASFWAVCLPFLLLAPSGFFQDAVMSQLQRIPGGGRAPVMQRLEEMSFGGGAPGAILLVAAVAVLVAGSWAVRPRRPSPLGAFSLLSAGLVVTAQFLTIQYYPQYPALVIPFVAVATGLAAGRLRGALRWSQRWSQPGSAVAVMAIIGLLLVSQAGRVEGQSTPDLEGAVQAVVPVGACTLGRTALLVTADRFLSGSAGCTEAVDMSGSALAYVHDQSAGVAVYRAAIGHADYLVLTSGVDGWLEGAYSELRTYVAGHFRMVRSGAVFIYVRDGFPG